MCSVCVCVCVCDMSCVIPCVCIVVSYGNEVGQPTSRRHLE